MQELLGRSGGGVHVNVENVTPQMTSLRALLEAQQVTLLADQPRYIPALWELGMVGALFVVIFFLRSHCFEPGSHKCFEHRQTEVNNGT